MLTEDFKKFIIETKDRFKNDEAVTDVIEEMERDIERVKGSALTLSILLNGSENE